MTPAEDTAVEQAQSRAATPMFDFAWWMPFAILLPALLLRIVNIGGIRYPLDDSLINVPSAANFTLGGLLGPDTWWTPPLKHSLAYVLTLPLGNDHVGWRLRGVLFSGGVVLLTFLIARRAFRRLAPAVIATVLVALDPLSIAFARTTFEDVPASFFILLAVLFWMRARQRGSSVDWLAVGLSLGAAGALRWYALLPAMVIVAFTLVAERTSSRAERVKQLCLLVLVPIGTYVLAYLPWFARGHGISDWIGLHLDAFAVQGSGFVQSAGQLASLAGPGKWFLGWVGAAAPQRGSTAYAVMTSNPPLWILFLPAVGYLAYIALKRRVWSWGIVAACFIALYLFFLAVQRSILLYSALPLVPFGFLALGFCAERLLKRWSWTFLGVAVAWSLYLYPVTSAIPVPLGLYAWLLRLLGVEIPS